MSTSTALTQPTLPPNTIIPENWDLFIPYFNKLYDDIASTVNNKDDSFYPMAITTTATNILNVPNFGAFLISVSGMNEGLPCITASLCKASTSSSGSVTVLGSQAGNIAPWAAATLTISSTTTNFQINHSATGKTGNFNIKIIGTQSGGI